MQKTYQNNPTDLLQFQKDAGNKKLMLLFYSTGSNDFRAKVWTIEITLQALISMLSAHNARSFEAEIGYVVTIENIRK